MTRQLQLGLRDELIVDNFAGAAPDQHPEMTPFDACVWFWLQLWFGAWR